MPSPVTVTCPECGTQLKLKSRARPGKKRPCPKCEVRFVLGEQYRRIEQADMNVPKPITVRYPESGAQLKLKSRASLGKKRPCPKREVPFVLGDDPNRDSYDLDARGVAAQPKNESPVLKRGVSRSSDSSATRVSRSAS